MRVAPITSRSDELTIPDVDEYCKVRAAAVAMVTTSSVLFFVAMQPPAASNQIQELKLQDTGRVVCCVA